MAANEDDFDQQLPGLNEGEIIVIRSKRRKRTISAYRQGGRIVVSIPARLTKAEERSAVPEMVAKIRAQEIEKTVDESALATRVDELLGLYAPEITERPVSVTWRTMRERWGSCTNLDATIRISSRLQRTPSYVLDFVLFHEAVHLRYGDHGPAFKAVLARYPMEELAQAYLDGYEAAESDLTVPDLPNQSYESPKDLFMNFATRSKNSSSTH